MNEVLLAGVRSSARHPALITESVSLTHAELLDRAQRLAEMLLPQPGPVTICGSHSPSAIVAICAAFLARRPWTVISTAIPAQRVEEMASILPFGSLVTDTESLPQFRVALQYANAAILADQYGNYGAPRVLRRRSENPAPNSAACIFFTSGSTGGQKAVSLNHANLAAFQGNLIQRFDLGPGRKLSLLHDLSSSAALQNLLLALGSGAALVLLPDRRIPFLVRHLREFQVDLVHIVPSAVRMLDRLRLLQPGVLPRVLDTALGGEILTQSIVRTWGRSAPEARIVNSYGPTELTATISLGECSPTERPDRDIVPVGVPFSDHQFFLGDEAGRVVAPGLAGELYVAGPQVALGYLYDPDAPNERFQEFPDANGVTRRWYRTGDLAIQNSDDAPLTIVGRRDRQIQLNGYRVEPAEVERKIRDLFPDVEDVAAIGISGGSDDLQRLITYVVGPSLQPLRILEQCRSHLPSWMVPHAVVPLSSLPLTVTGKTDYRALQELSVQERAVP
jgi:amino acid adenylation domain-containing protein